MSQAQTSTQVLSQLLEPLGRMMPLSLARELAALRATPEVQARLHELADKSTEGELTVEEQAKHRTHVDAIDVTSLLQAKARSEIAGRPNP